MTVHPYDRQKAVSYCEEYAFKRNSKYLDFTGIGGDCTNFISQCVYAGSGVMNYKPVYGWFYKTSSNRTASWTGVNQFYNFITKNQGVGPFASLVPLANIQLGDVIQLGDSTGHFYHSLLVTHIEGTPDFQTVFVGTHSNDAFQRRLSTYEFAKYRCLHIDGVRK